MFVFSQMQLLNNRVFILAILIVLSINRVYADTSNDTSTHTSRSGAWTVSCQSSTSTADPACIATQLITKTNNAKQVVMGVTVGYEAQHPLPHIIFRISPGANIHKGAAVKIDQQEYVSIPISTCDDNVCEVRSFIPQALLEQMQQGKYLQFAFFIKNQQFTYPISLDGFAQLYQILQSNHT